MVLVLDSLDSPALRQKMLDALGFASTNLNLFCICVSRRPNKLHPMRVGIPGKE